MLDYEELYVRIMHYLHDRGLVQTLADAAIEAEAITEIIEQKVEEEISDGTQ